MFLTLAIVWLAGDGFERREDMLWHVLFGSNVLFFLRGEFGSSLAHFWSLAVEQQFYLAWPFLILFAPKKYLETVILALIVIAPLSRMALAAHGFTHFAQFNVLPFANFDSLGLGALMALWLRRSATEVAERWSVLNWAALMSLAGLVASPWATVPGNVEQTLYAVLFALLIVAAFRGIGGTVGRLLENPMLVALGTISYGVYVYHMFAPRIVGAVLRKFEAPLVLHSGLPLFLFSAFLTLVVATLSWRLMEAPILSLGKRSSQSVSRFRPMPQPK
jgi:peptidoglycan/LPS O-acetylase OafA/YrhL